MSCRWASSGITLCLWPARKEPTVTTAGSCGSTRRLTSVCRAVTKVAAVTIGSDARWGRAPCPPRPGIRTSTESTLAKAQPEVRPTSPAGRSDST